MQPVDEPRDSFAYLILDPAAGCAAAYLGGSTKPDQEGLIVSNVINSDVAGSREVILLTSELLPGNVHLLHRHPDSEQIIYVLEDSCPTL
jgi:hypothetical protein